MRTLGDGGEDADLTALGSAVLLYGIVGIVLGMISVFFIVFCAYCNFIAPFCCIVSGLAVYRGTQLLPQLRKRRLDDSNCLVGTILGAFGLLFGVCGVLVTLLVGCVMSVYGMLVAAILSS